MDGRPHRLILDRPTRPFDEPRDWIAGEALVARVESVHAALGMIFLDAGSDAPPLTASAGPAVGERVCATVSAPARREKLATARITPDRPGDAPLGRRTPRPSVSERLQAVNPSIPLIRSAEARRLVDEAEDEATAAEHALPGGGRLWIERTRALIAVDVDVATSAWSGSDARRRRTAANVAALRALPRLLHLMGLGGVVAVDLAGKGHDGKALAEVAKAAFTPLFGAETAIGPISRFGVLQLQLPWRDTPVADLLLDGRGGASPLTRAFRLLREIEREAGPGGRVSARCAPVVFTAAQPYVQPLKAVIGDRFALAADASLAPDQPVVSPQ